MDKFLLVRSALAMVRDGKISPSAFLVYCHLLTACGDGLECDAGEKEIRDTTGLTERPVVNALNMLIASGMISRKKGFGRNSHYCISINIVQNTTFNTSLLINSCSVENCTKANTDGNAIMDFDDDGPTPDSDPTPFLLLSDAFSSKTGIMFHNPPRWNKAINDMIAAGVEAQDVEKGIEWLKCSGRPYPISGPWSVITSAVVELGKRKNPDTPGKNGRRQKPEVFLEEHGNPHLF